MFLTLLPFEGLETLSSNYLKTKESFVDMKPTVEQDEMFPEGVNPPNWEMEEVY